MLCTRRTLRAEPTPVPEKLARKYEKPNGKYEKCFNLSSRRPAAHRKLVAASATERIAATDDEDEAEHFGAAKQAAL